MCRMYQCPTKPVVRKWAQAIETAVYGHAQCENYQKCVGRSPALLWTAQIGHYVCPRFHLDYDAIRSERDRLRRWVYAQDGNYRFAAKQSTSIRLRQSLDDWGWTVVAPGLFDTPGGMLSIYNESEAAIKLAAVEAWQRVWFKSDARTGDNVTQQLAAVGRPVLATFKK